MVYQFSLIDPQDRLCELVCIFPVLFSQDEEALEVVGFRYERRPGA